MPDDPHNTRTCSKTIFKGLFLVCRMRRPVAQEAFVLPGSPRPGFGPELENWEQQLRRAVDARELRMSFRGDLMFAAFATDRQIMAVSKDIDPKIIEEYRRSFQDSVDLMKGLMAVSYTHLDVYKRQVPHCLPAPPGGRPAAGRYQLPRPHDQICPGACQGGRKGVQLSV